MVSLKALAGATMAALMLPTTVAQATPAQVVQNINTLTEKSSSLQPVAESITAVNGPLLIAGQGPFPVIIRGFNEILNTYQAYRTQMEGMAAVPAGAQSDSIYASFRDFVQVHQRLINTLTGKAGLFSDVPFIGGPMTAVLRGDENVVDDLTFTLADVVSSHASDIQSSGKGLSDSVSTCIKQYEGFQTTKRDFVTGPISRVKRGIVAAY